MAKGLILTTLLGLASACMTPADHSSGVAKPPAKTQAEQAVTRPMLLLGSGPIYLAVDQVLLEVEMRKSGHDPQGTYAYDRQVTGERIYTVVPEPLLLSELILPAGSPERKTFKGDLVRGTPGQGGSVFLTRLSFKVKRVIYASKAKAAQQLTVPQYLVFGTLKELFAVRMPADGGAFPEVLAVRVRDGILNAARAESLRRGTFVRLPEELSPGAVREAEARVGTETLPVSLEATEQYPLTR